MNSSENGGIKRNNNNNNTFQSGFHKQIRTFGHLVCFKIYIKEAYNKKNLVVSILFDLEGDYILLEE